MNTEIEQTKLKLQSLLNKLFQFDSANLDFGIYRILNQKKVRIKEFIDKELLEDAEKQFKEINKTNTEQIENEIKNKLEEIIKAVGADAIQKDGTIHNSFSTMPIIKEYQELLKKRDEIEISITEVNDVYNTVYEFFSRYYDKGDFYSKRRYSGKNKYVLPYNGEEVVLNYANSDQYYVKTTDNFNNYTFKEGNHKIHFKIKHAQIEQNNTKGEKKYFLLTLENSIEEKGNEISFYFEYRPLTENEKNEYGTKNTQDKINEIIIKEFSKQKFNAKATLLREKDEEIILLNHLEKYTTRNTSDYFIHKDLQGFLTKELEFFIKNEVIDLDKITSLDEKSFKKTISKAKTIRTITEKVIEFISQIENFQKMLWEKKKFVLSTNYVISLCELEKIIPRKEFEDLVFKNKSQLLSDPKYLQDIENILKELYRDTVSNIFVKKVSFENSKIQINYVKRTKTDTEESFKDWSNYNDEKPQFISYEKIYIDTFFFDNNFKYDLLQLISNNKNFEDIINGVAIKSENWQALELIQNKYFESIDLIYIDPPFNTERSDFLYKDNYLDSTWICFLKDRIQSSLELVSKRGSLYLHLDYNGDYLGRFMIQNNLVFKRELVWDTGGWRFGQTRPDFYKNYLNNHQTILYFTKPDSCIFNPPLNKITNELDGEGRKRISSIITDTLQTQDTQFNRKENIGFPTQKTEDFMTRIIPTSSNEKSIVLDYFCGSGTTIATAHKLNRYWIGIEQEKHFETIILPRMKKVLIGDQGGISKEVGWVGGGSFKYQYIEQFEDSLNNIVFDDKGIQQKLGDSEYFLKYLLDYETKDSPTRLSVARFDNPWDYKLNILRDGELINESIDLIETFNYLSGIKINSFKSITNKNNKYIAVIGKRKESNTIIIWRNIKDWDEKDFKEDKKFIEENILENKKYDNILVNGDSFIDGAEAIEPEFKRLMGA